MGVWEQQEKRIIYHSSVLNGSSVFHVLDACLFFSYTRLMNTVDESLSKPAIWCHSGIARPPWLMVEPSQDVSRFVGARPKHTQTPCRKEPRPNIGRSSPQQKGAIPRAAHDGLTTSFIRMILFIVHLGQKVGIFAVLPGNEVERCGPWDRFRTRRSILGSSYSNLDGGVWSPLRSLRAPNVQSSSQTVSMNLGFLKLDGKIEDTVYLWLSGFIHQNHLVCCPTFKNDKKRLVQAMTWL